MNKYHKGLPKLPPQYSLTKGGFIAWKHLRSGHDRGSHTHIAQLYVPRTAQVVRGGLGTKMRASEVKVLGIWKAQCYYLNGQLYRRLGKPCRRVRSLCVVSDGYDATYTVGKKVRPRKAFDSDVECSCSSGIHFYRTRRETLRQIGL